MTKLTITLTVDSADLDSATTVGQIEDALRIPVRVGLASLQGSLNAEVRLVGMTISSDVAPWAHGVLGLPLFLRPQAQ